MLENFFQLGPIPTNQIIGTYSPQLVLLSFIVATGASYVALDITSRMRDIGVTKNAQLMWLIAGCVAMGAGIWSMHFIGMLAFIMPMPMSYEPFLTGLSMVIAIIASGIAFSLLRPPKIKLSYFIIGGIILGLSIASMHYVGMAAMIGMKIHYLPSYFFLSIVIAIVASEAALYLAIQSSKGSIHSRLRLKTVSAFIMGAAICGMHYTGMAAAVFTPLHHLQHPMGNMPPDMMAISIATVTILILGLAVAASSFQAILSTRSAEMARKAGMAEVASNVLHNIGNMLNSVNVSSTLITEHLHKIDLQHLRDVNALFDEHKGNLSHFFATDPRGVKLIIFLNQLESQWQKEFDSIKNEITQLANSIEHIKNVIAMQQKISGVSNFEELVNINSLLDEALILVGIDFDRHGIHIEKKYTPKLKETYIDKSKLMQIVINLIRNAKESVTESKNPEKVLSLKTTATRKKFCIEIKDNGLGISEANKTKIFTHGFTTKETGHGFGLHASALAASEMDGSLSLTSEGLGKGATFKLVFPLKLNINIK